MDYDPEEGVGFEQVFTLFNEEGINARYEDKQTVAGSSLDQIYLTISNSALDFNQARLWINETSKFLEKVVLTNRMQIITTYAFSNIKMDQGLPESTFVFDTANFRGEVYDER
jgi:outer membrane lipoprotein-sorting protein